jgi:hypothetical protein
MARTARILVMGYPHHITRRGQLTGSVRFVEEIEKKAKGGVLRAGKAKKIE